MEAIGIYLAQTCNLNLRVFYLIEEKYLPSTWCCTEIDHTLGLRQEIILFVELDKLEGSTRSESLLLGHIIILI
jgi:hypothetical protein